MKKVTAGDREYQVAGNPSMRTVKHVQRMEIELMRDYIDDDKLLELEEADEDNIMEDVLEDADLDDLQELLWERSTQEAVKTICLGSDEQVTLEEVMDMDAIDFRDLREACEDELGGNATDFIRELGIDIGSQERIAQAVQEGSNGTSDSTPPAVSDLSSEQSKETGATQPTKST